MSDISNPFGKINKLPKPKILIRTETETVKAPGELTQKIKEVGDRMRPAGMNYLGSICIHIYKGVLNPNVEVRTMDLSEKVTNIEANWALQQASIAVATRRGWKAPAKRQDVFRKDSGIVTPDLIDTKDETLIQNDYQFDSAKVESSDES